MQSGCVTIIVKKRRYSALHMRDAPAPTMHSEVDVGEPEAIAPVINKMVGKKKASILIVYLDKRRARNGIIQLVG
jgi:hypothetical protein